MAEAVAKKKRRRAVEEDESVLDLIDFGDEEEEVEEEEEVAPKPKAKRKKQAPSGPSIQGAIAKLQAIRNEITTQVFEREDVIDDLLRCLVAGENILLLGPPGTGKSYLANLMAQHIDGARKFSWLMNRTTDPADIVGPYSVKAMENDRFLRITTGKMPKAHVSFLDEIFKANEPVLNYMLSMLNEGVIYNDGKAEPVDLRLTIGASNEYPESEDLDAFYDRFVFRHWVNYIQDPQNRVNMANAARSAQKYTPTLLTLDEIDALQAEVKNIQFPAQVAATYDKMIRALQAQDIHVSDRRYVKGQTVMMANALLNGRTSVTTEDFKSLTFMMWNKDVKEIEIVSDELSKFVNPYESKIKEFVRKAEEVKNKVLSVENRAERAGEAVQANVSLQDILEKIDKEITQAKKEGVDINPLAKMYESVEEMMNTVATECLKQTSRGSRKW